MMERPKMGFAIPIENWLATDLKNQVLYYLSDENIMKQDIFDLKFIQKIKNDIVIPNTIGHKVEETNLSYKIPEKFSFEKFYLINSKIFKVFFSIKFNLSQIHPKIVN